MDADPNSWRYAPTRHGGWLPPGVPARPKDGVMVMPSNFDPRGRGEPVHLMLSPPGTPAPPGLLSYTPALGRVHAPGDPPPADLENLSVVPARMAGPAAGGGMSPGGPPPGVGALPGGMGSPAPIPPPNMIPAPQAPMGMAVPPPPPPQPGPAVPGLPPRADMPPTPPGQGVGGQSHLGMRAQELLSQLLATPSQPDMPIGGGQDVGVGEDMTELQTRALQRRTRQYEGTPYRYAGNDLTKGIDCSGFVNEILRGFGARLPERPSTVTYRTQLAAPISWDDIRPGDILLSAANPGNPGPGEHMALYVGGGQMAESTDARNAQGRNGVRVGSVQGTNLRPYRLREPVPGLQNATILAQAAADVPVTGATAQAGQQAQGGDMRLMSAEGQQDPHQAITQYAVQNLGPEGARVFLGIMSQEGGVRAGRGDTNIPGVGSYGPLQFHGGTGPGEAGQLNNFAQAMGMGLREAGAYAQANPVEAAKWAVDNYLGNAIRDGVNRGLSGPALVRRALQAQNSGAAPDRYIEAYNATPLPSATSAQTTAQPNAPQDFLSWLGGQVQGGIEGVLSRITPTAYAAEETAAVAPATPMTQSPDRLDANRPPVPQAELTNPAPRIMPYPNMPVPTGIPGASGLTNAVINAGGAVARGIANAVAPHPSTPRATPPPPAPTQAAPTDAPPAETTTPKTPAEIAAEARAQAMAELGVEGSSFRVEQDPVSGMRIMIVDGKPLASEAAIAMANPELYERHVQTQANARGDVQAAGIAQRTAAQTALQNERLSNQRFMQETALANQSRNSQIMGSAAAGFQIPFSQAPHGYSIDESLGVANIFGPNGEVTRQISLQSGPRPQVTANGERIVYTQPGREPRVQRVADTDIDPRSGRIVHRPADPAAVPSVLGFAPERQTINNANGYPMVEGTDAQGRAYTAPIPGATGDNRMVGRYATHTELGPDGQVRRARESAVPADPHGGHQVLPDGRVLMFDDTTGTMRVIGQGRSHFEVVGGRLLEYRPPTLPETFNANWRPTTFGDREMPWAGAQSPAFASAQPEDRPRPRGMFVPEDRKPLAQPEPSSEEYWRAPDVKEPEEDEDMIGSGQSEGVYGGPYGYEEPSGYGPTTGYPYPGYGGGGSQQTWASPSIGGPLGNIAGQSGGDVIDHGMVPQGVQAINVGGGSVAIIDKMTGKVINMLGDPNADIAKEERAYSRQQASEDRAYSQRNASEERTAARQERSDERSQQFALQRDMMAAENQRKPKWVAPSVIEGRRGSLDYFDPNSGAFLPVRQSDPEDIKMDTYNIYVPAGRSVSLDYGGGQKGTLSGGSMPQNQPMQLPGTLSGMGGGGGYGGGWAPQGMGGGFGGNMGSPGMGSLGSSMGGSGMGSLGGGYGSGMGSMSGMSSMGMGGRGMGGGMGGGWSPMGMSGGTNSLMQQYLMAQQQAQQQAAMEQAYQVPFGQAQGGLAAAGIDPWATPRGYGNTMGPMAAGLGGLNAFTPYGGYGG